MSSCACRDKNMVLHQDFLPINWLGATTTRCLCGHILHTYVYVHAYLRPDDAIACYVTTDPDDPIPSMYFIILLCSWRCPKQTYPLRKSKSEQVEELKNGCLARKGSEIGIRQRAVSESFTRVIGMLDQVITSKSAAFRGTSATLKLLSKLHETSTSPKDSFIRGTARFHVKSW